MWAISLHRLRFPDWKTKIQTRESQLSTSLPLPPGFLTPDEMWHTAPSSCHCCCRFPTTMGSTAQLWAQTISSSLKPLLAQYLDTAARKVTSPDWSTELWRTSSWFHIVSMLNVRYNLISLSLWASYSRETRGLHGRDSVSWHLVGDNASLPPPTTYIEPPPPHTWALEMEHRWNVIGSELAN